MIFRLIHWCHGAPGAIHLFIKAYQVFESEEYIEAAKKCANVIWYRGLLKKGYGLCHGIAGNTYAFLALCQATNEVEYLVKAEKFVEFMFDYDEHLERTPDRPYSLFEGIAGTIYLLDDMEKHPMKATFPGFYVF